MRGYYLVKPTNSIGDGVQGESAHTLVLTTKMQKTGSFIFKEF
jgi:hypothetical protein